jgi:hypothetical protein
MYMGLVHYTAKITMNITQNKNKPMKFNENAEKNRFLGEKDHFSSPKAPVGNLIIYCGTY